MKGDFVIPTILKILRKFCVDCIKSFSRINCNGNVKIKHISSI
jgi:hypothetical protein